MQSTVVIADDHPLYREALIGSIVKQLPELTLLESADYLSLFDMLKEQRDEIDLVLLDLSMPGCQGYSGLIFIKKYFPEIPVLIITAHNSAEIMSQCQLFNADGFVSKTASSDTIVSKISHLLESDDVLSPQLNMAALAQQEQLRYHKVMQLTPHQFHILSLVADGLLNKQIAAQLEISEKTVKAHLSKIFKILDVGNRTQAAKFVAGLALTTSWQH
ncbi:response regulator transcription factor [Shewanella sp. WXL01]|uniref:Response regulator transcription factor n=1 Tax=Shewanella maritima TaxID=2520507 RepID=A0A411PER8_9GAMM|nr:MULTISPECIES: response regulator transcription factor [Shewanella]NKF49899.1 response regulator transcription factor [Shewanella sp. WXL01]QBF82041.1 response regulator transcription factor [Shewanella maritima]